MNPLKPLAFALLGLAVTPVRAVLTPMTEESPGALARQAVLANAATVQKGLGDWLIGRTDTYDFSVNARKALESITEDPEFLGSQTFRELAPGHQTPGSILPPILEFMEGSSKYSAGTVAWIRLFASPGSNWEQSYPLYLKVAAERPDDFIPKAFLLCRPITTATSGPEWFSLFEDAYASASTGLERSFCLLMLPGHAARAADIPDSEAHLQKITGWIDNIEKNESVERLPLLRDIGGIRFFVAFAQRDYATAAALAKSAPPLDKLRPILLILADKNDEAKSALEELQQRPSLSETDRSLLDSTATILRALATPR